MSSCFWHLSTSIFITFGWTVPNSMSLKHNGFIPRWIWNALNQVFAKCAPKFHISWAWQRCLLELIPLHCADWYNGFSSAWIMNVCLYKQALVLVLDLVHPQCAAAYMCGNLGLTLKIYLYFIINEQKKKIRMTISHMSSVIERIFHYLLSALLPEPSCPASTGEVQQLFWAQKEKSWVAFSKENIRGFFLPQCVLGTASSWDGKWRKRRKHP